MIQVATSATGGTSCYSLREVRQYFRHLAPKPRAVVKLERQAPFPGPELLIPLPRTGGKNACLDTSATEL